MTLNSIQKHPDYSPEMTSQISVENDAREPSVSLKQSPSDAMKLAVNRQVKNKARPGTDDFKLLATEFENVTFTLNEIAAAIAAGFSWCAQHVDRRKAVNFVCTDVLGVDLDEGWTFDSLLAHDLVANHGLLIYETYSSTPERPRLRAMFRSPYTITDADEMRKILRGLVRMFGSDESCVDPCRMFYGNEGCEPHIIDKTLTAEQIEYLKELGATQGDDDRQDGGNRNANNFVRSSLHVAEDQLLRARDGKHVPLSVLASGTPVHCPHHADRNPSAFVTMSSQGIRGVHCSKCQQTFWPETMRRSDLKQHDFEQFDRALFAGELSDAAHNVVVKELDAQYLSPELIAFHPGVHLIKSPKGSGKTHLLRPFVQHCIDVGESVLLVSHRIALASASANRLGMFCYLDKYDREIGNDRYMAYAVCLDSLRKKLRPGVHSFDHVIIDESEQLFSHFLSSTLDGKRATVFHTLSFYVREAKTVVVCDADLGRLTFEAIKCCRDGMGIRGYLREDESELQD
ncbi:signal recognition particle [Burkholderia ubonensis]|uniref:Signal recognition particle n=1 Tax=Burkholderia ubonensis TaxID=101571 RepID=A0ABD6Q6G3_9BURK|nr:signal recognition particle [Burkholderia ubonensis]KVT36553.1 signal recognition particle [Burkholderia ubonensis]KVZ86012.1 signal recognition particle [Burkholderia ubonensis]KWE29241.1 signal recognition particle [Burkholderia ubonensis]OJA48735.1 signal recognition particle [Burkholderia ubonensis]